MTNAFTHLFLFKFSSFSLASFLVDAMIHLAIEQTEKTFSQPLRFQLHQQLNCETEISILIFLLSARFNSGNALITHSSNRKPWITFPIWKCAKKWWDEKNRRTEAAWLEFREQLVVFSFSAMPACKIETLRDGVSICGNHVEVFDIVMDYFMVFVDVVHLISFARYNHEFFIIWIQISRFIFVLLSKQARKLIEYTVRVQVLNTS